MPRTPSHFYSPLRFGGPHQDDESDEPSSEEEAYEQEDDVEAPYTVDDIDFDDYTSGSDLFRELKSVSDEALVFVAAACLERVSDAGFFRLLSSHRDENFKKEAKRLWKNEMVSFGKHHICNGCGKETLDGDLCCGEIIKYHRVGALQQLVDIVKQYMEDILKIRSRLRNGSETSHNLTGDLLSRLWKSESGNVLKLSVIGSIDGVSLTGNTRKKVWPVTMLLLDLPTADMQRAKNIVIHGIAEGAVNPSTHFWNTIIPMIYVDIEAASTEVQGFKVQFGIASWVADQPAKRSLFGMRGCNSEGSCFFGMCTGTHYKKKRENRSAVRTDELTDEDGEKGQNGFGSIPPRILEYLHPYDTVLDLLHNAAGGIFSTVLSEATCATRDKRSDLFDNDIRIQEGIIESVIVPRQYDIKSITNCSEKLTFFRIHFGLASLTNPTLKPEARLVVSSLMLLTNALYNNAPIPDDRFFEHLTDAARRCLENASREYLSTKAHELIAHLPDVIIKFGNIAPISTFAYEHFYKFALKGFNAQKTNKFTESAISRLLLHSGICREIQLRFRASPSSTLQEFLNSTPSLKLFKPTWMNPIHTIHPEDEIPDLINCEYYATLSLSIGRLQSNYKAGSLKNQIFFASDKNGIHCCYRFILLAVRDSDAVILGEKIRSLEGTDHFPLLQEMIDEMDKPMRTFGRNIFNQFKFFGGLIHGKPSGERELLLIKDVRGVGGYLPADGSSGYFLQLNGSCVHY